MLPNRQTQTSGRCLKGKGEPGGIVTQFLLLDKLEGLEFRSVQCYLFFLRFEDDEDEEGRDEDRSEDEEVIVVNHCFVFCSFGTFWI